jgi:hypothetical protein
MSELEKTALKSNYLGGDDSAFSSIQPDDELAKIEKEVGEIGSDSNYTTNQAHLIPSKGKASYSNKVFPN